MKKLSLLVGTLGGAVAGYVFSNKKMRDELSKAKDAEDAAKIFGQYMQQDGKKLAKQVREFIESDEVRTNMVKAQKFVADKAKEAKKEIESYVKEGKKTSAKSVKEAVKKATKAIGVKKSPAKKQKSASVKTKRMRTETRKLT